MSSSTSAHSWNVTPKEAIAIREELRSQVKLTPLNKQIRTIAGCDVSMNLYSSTAHAGFVVLSYPELEVIDHSVVKDQTHFPYVPGLLSFREIPALMKAWEKLKAKPDIIMVDGQGVAHPRRLGIASHLGVILDMPTIGCAKNVLLGKYKPPKRAGDVSPLIDPRNEEIIGNMYQSKDRCKPLVISAGHLVTQEQALDMVRSCLRGYRLPEPTRQAHLYMNKYRRGEMKMRD